jgi:hypothetical protein
MPRRKQIIRWVARLYPRPWRDRYGEEFDALLDDAPAGASAAIDILLGAIRMQIRTWTTAVSLALLAVASLAVAAWRAGQQTTVSPGAHLVLRQDSSNLGAAAGFLLCLAAGIGILVSAVLRSAGNSRQARRVWRISAATFGGYVAAVIVVSLLTPRTIVSVGDGYCYDLWCIGVQQVHASPQGANLRYTAEVRLFSDANRVPTRRDKEFLYVLDEQGRRYPVMQEATAVPLDTTLGPGESVNTSVTFLAPANAGKLYLAGGSLVMPWVPFYLGSDIAPFHRRTLLRVS